MSGADVFVRWLAGQGCLVMMLITNFIQLVDAKVIRYFVRAQNGLEI